MKKAPIPMEKSVPVHAAAAHSSPIAQGMTPGRCQARLHVRRGSCRGAVRPPVEYHPRRDSRFERDGHPGQPPVDLGGRPHDRHPDDPAGGRPEQVVRQHACPPAGGCASIRRCQRTTQHHGGARPDRQLGRHEGKEVGAAALPSEPTPISASPAPSSVRTPRRLATKPTASAETPALSPDTGPQLTRCGRGDAEVGGHGGQHRRARAVRTVPRACTGARQDPDRAHGSRLQPSCGYPRGVSPAHSTGSFGRRMSSMYRR